MENEFPIKALIKYEESMILTYENRTEDDRKRVEDSTEFPFRPIGALISKQKDGNYYLGTGVLIAPNYVLTVAHNPFDENYRAPEFYFLPGINGTKTNFKYSKGSEFFIFDSYEKDELGPDIAIMKLEQPLGDYYGYFDIKELEKEKDFQQKRLLFYGYPGDKYKEANFSYELWGQPLDSFKIIGEDNNEDLSKQTKNLEFPCDSYSGMSGSPIFEFDEKTGKAAVYGVFFSHYYVDYNDKRGYAWVLTEKIINEIREYINKTDDKK